MDSRNAPCHELESGSGCTSDPVSTRAITRRSWRGETTRGCALTMRTPPRWGQNRSFYRVDPAAGPTPETAARRAAAKQLCVGVVGKLCILVCACRTEKGRKGASSATTPTLRHSDNTTQHNTTPPGQVSWRDVRNVNPTFMVLERRHGGGAAATHGTDVPSFWSAAVAAARGQASGSGGQVRTKF